MARNPEVPSNWGERNLGPQANLRLAREVGLTDIPAEVTIDTEVLTRTAKFTTKHISPDGNPIKIGVAERAKRRPSKHTIASVRLGAEKPPKKTEQRPRKAGENKGKISVKAKSGERIYISRSKTRPGLKANQAIAEGLEAPVVQKIEVRTTLLPERTVYLDPELIKEESQFAGLSEKLEESQKLDPTNPDDEQVDPDSLVGPVEIWSLEGMQEHISDRVPGENEGMYDYAATAIDIRS